MSFDIRNFAVFDIAGTEIWFTETILMTWIIMLILILFAVVARVKLTKFSEKPTGFQNVVETMVEMLDKFVSSMAGPRLQFLGSWFFMVFTFVAVSNISGAFGLRPPTADWAMTFALALSTFALIHIMGAKFRGGRYFLSLLNPLNLIGELAKPVSLSFRLFGNILAGIILMTMVYNVPPIWFSFILPAALHGYFDVAIGLLQTYIFCALSLAFIGGAAGIEQD